MKHLYGDLKMTWFKVILFAIVAGIYTGFILTVPILKDTSFQDIGISYEWWVIFAVIIVVNCKKSWEAMLKCFVFFLISQPLVYLTEILLGCLSSEMGMYYYLNIWLPMTFLTIPGGFIAYFCKKQNPFGSIVLGLGNTIQTILGISYFGRAMNNFPHHLLSGIVCILSIFVMSISIQKERKNRIIAIVFPVLLTVVLLILIKMNGRVLF